MDTIIPYALLCFTSFFTLTNPLGTMPVFLTMTNGLGEQERRHIVKRATIISFIILIVISNMFVWLDRLGQIKIGFYLLLLSNFYMLYLLKQKKSKIFCQ